MGIPYGVPADVCLLDVMVNMLPDDAQWASFSIGRNQLPWVEHTVRLGGHVRAGLEDNLYLSKGVKATNAQLVTAAVDLIENLGHSVGSPAEARATLQVEGTK